MSMTRNEFKQEAAIRCIQGMLANPNVNPHTSDDGRLAAWAVGAAEALAEAYGADQADAFFECTVEKGKTQ